MNRKKRLPFDKLNHKSLLGGDWLMMTLKLATIGRSYEANCDR